MGANWTGGVVDRRGDGPPTVDEWRPVDGDEGATAADAAERIAYRTTIADPRESDDRRALLELRGAPPNAEIWLDGDRVGVRDGEFGPFRTAFEPGPGSETELVVVPDRDDPAFAPASATPADRLDVDVRSRPQTFVRRLEARPRLTDDGGVIAVEIEVDAGRSVADAVTLSVRPEGFRGGATMQRVPVEADAGERVTVSKTLEVREPALWWPDGCGPQHRYEVQAKLGADTAATTAAFRDLERDGDDLLVNGERVRLRGFVRSAGGDPVADVRRAAEANGNLLRVRGHVPPEPFYAACDEAGVLVWQELPVPDTDSDTGDAVRDVASALEDAYGHRPSLGLYGVVDADGPTPSATASANATAPVDGLHGSSALTKLRFRYRTWRADADREAVEAGTAALREALPDDRPVVSSVGPPGTDPDAAALFPGWRYLAAGDVDWLLERWPELGRFVGAFGAGSLAADDVDPADVPGLEAAILEARLGADPGLEESQTYQARTLKTVAEGLRRHGSTAIVAERLRDPATGGGTGVLTADGDPKPAYEALAESFEPVQAVLDGPPEPGSVGITLCNDTRESVDATVRWSAGDADGETTASVGPLERTDAGAVDVPPDADRIRLAVALGDRTVTNRYHL